MDHEDHDETAHLVASKKIMTTENQKSIGLSREQNTTTEMISRDALFFFPGAGANVPRSYNRSWVL
jgi:hypothetical protein